MLSDLVSRGSARSKGIGILLEGPQNGLVAIVLVWLGAIVLAGRLAGTMGIAVDARCVAFAIQLETIGFLAVAGIPVFHLIPQSSNDARGKGNRSGIVHLALILDFEKGRINATHFGSNGRFFQSMVSIIVAFR